MALKKVDAYANEVQAMGFEGIKKDSTLFNAVSKALAKAQNKDQFHFLNDKNRDARYLYLKYVKPNVINIAGSVQNMAKLLAEGPAPDPAKLELLMKGITNEVNKLFKTNIKGALLTSEAFKIWCQMQNLPEAKKLATASAVKVSKVLGLSDPKQLSIAMVLMATGEKAKASSMLATIAKEEKKKDIAKVVEASLKASGLL